jgi:hypothetical protein
MKASRTSLIAAQMASGSRAAALLEQMLELGEDLFRRFGPSSLGAFNGGKSALAFGS